MPSEQCNITQESFLEFMGSRFLRRVGKFSIKYQKVREVVT